MKKITKKNLKKKALDSKNKKLKTKINPTRYGDWEKKGRCIDFYFFLFKRDSTKSWTTPGSASVETSPN